MIYQDVKRYLKRNYQTPSKEYQWSGHDNLRLLNYIQSRYSDEQIQNNSSEIKQAFRDFYEPICALVIRFKLDTGIAYKVIPYHVNPKNSKHLKNIIDIIRKNRRYIEYPYHERDDQIALLGRIRRHINAEIIETDEAINKKELVRYAIKEALELDGRDVVLHLQRKYIVKIFKKNSLLNSYAKEPMPKDDAENRFQGFNSQDLSNHYNELINDINIEAFLDNVMALLFAGKLNFDEITNNYYEANVLSLVRNTIAQELKQYVSQNEEYLLGFAGYIFRNNFEAIHQRIAIEIFEQVSVKNKNAELFLSYYSGTVLVENGKRYIIPELSTPDGKRWNITSISATASMWLRTRHQEKKLAVEYKNLENDFTQVQIQYENVSTQYKQQSSYIEKYENELETIEKSISDARANFKLKNDGELSKIDTLKLSKIVQHNQQQVLTIKEKMLKITPNQSTLKTEAKMLKSKYLDLKAKKQLAESELRILKKNLNINSDGFNSILLSFVKALIQRKKLIVNP